MPVLKAGPLDPELSTLTIRLLCLPFLILSVSIPGLLQFAVHYYNKALEFPLYESSNTGGEKPAKVRLICVTMGTTKTCSNKESRFKSELKLGIKIIL